ncbi:tryptophan--tRNA ligase [Brevibacterium sp. ZH18]|uniref:tryptophan--tRNA ligase n=1 Tax=Brevibacterium sp. ZH18 TaxID=2927784 RepID=UPI001F61CC82|nr:tryptophan--tRNA ligase [Brevibacterium sp. ZH18]MCI4012190.1 tryptophan--tRNA ligase [Brevibacterium sp. ZH18]
MDSYDATLARMPRLRADVNASPGNYRMLTGERPTGRLHLGHLFGSVLERVSLQDKGIETFIILADYQVITDRDTSANVKDNVREAILDYLAAGIDPAKTTIFTHSSVPALNQLLLPFLSLVTDSELRRNPTVKSELEASDRPLSGLLLTYPVHQAADILFCKGNLVPVGKDNLPHVEITRTIARRFNERYERVFPEPEAMLTTAPDVPGLDGRKMSKSYGNSIALGMSEDETSQLIRKARTDSNRHITFDLEQRPGVSALLSTAAICTGTTPEAVAEEIGDGGAGALKSTVAEAVNEFLADHRNRRRQLETDESYIDEILAEGNARANVIADATLGEVRAAMGMDYRSA